MCIPAPRPPFRRSLLMALLAPLALLVPLRASSCLRSLVAPVAPTALNVIIKGELISGALVEFLQTVAQRGGCALQLRSLPRPRLDRMFFSDEVDILFPASRTSTRDRHAEFVAWFQLQPHLVMVNWNTEHVGSLRELLQRPSWHAVVVRSYSWGDIYDELLQQLDRLGRVTYVADLKTVHAMLRAGHARFTLLPPSLLYNSMKTDHQPAGLPADFSYQLLQDLPAAVVGMYLNPRRIAPDDIERLRRASARAVRDGTLSRNLSNYYAPEMLAIDTKVLP
jgi:polar amino acid transport system substrate-binding protein